MKKSTVVVFYTVFFSIYGLINAYIYFSGLRALDQGSDLRLIYSLVFLFFASSFIIGRYLERARISTISTIFVWIGSFWLGAMLYFVLASIIIDLLRLVLLAAPSMYPMLDSVDATFSRDLGFGVVVLVTVVLVIGHLNAMHPRVRMLTLITSKPIQGGKLSIAMASDWHLGTLVGSRRCEAIVRGLNALEADVILLPGDLVDEDLAPVIRRNLGEKLRVLKAPYGVYAVTGNHEYIGGVDRAVQYLRDHGITMLRDEVAELPCGVILVGREDRSSGMGGVARMDLRQLLTGRNVVKPVIVMDHQPFRLQEAVEAGVDLQLSGHTHHGQLWPFSLITKAVYEMSWGYLRKGGTQFYVSCGVGTWGPPVRTGNRPELVKIDLVSDQQSSPLR